ncbi:hypothetical protein ACOSQ4_027215 [Xanthoceras sorbifolium]
MAAVSISKNVIIIFMVAFLLVSTTVLAEDSPAAAPGPAPSVQTGGSFSLPVFGYSAGFSLVFYVLALLKL